MDNSKLCEMVKAIPSGAAHRRWTLRADNHGHHHSKVSLSECPLYLELNWRRSVDDSVQQVGVFRLNLAGLLREGYIRTEPINSRSLNVRLRIFRSDDGSFYVQTKRRGPQFLLPSGIA